MRIRNLICRYLREHGYDGLFNRDLDCACEAANIAPCGEISCECEAGYRVAGAGWEDNWRMQREKPGEVKP